MSETNDYTERQSVESLYDHTPRRGRPPKPKKRRGPKPKDPIPEIFLVEEALRSALGMQKSVTKVKEKESPEEQEAHKTFIQTQMLHAGRLAVIWVTGCISGKFRVETERAKLAMAAINHAIGTPVQKVSVVGESQETLAYVAKLKTLINKEDGDDTEAKQETDGELAEGM